MTDLHHPQRSRLTYRRLVRERGPDAGREVDHLKEASLAGVAEELLRRYEAGAITDPIELTRRDGDTAALLFMYDLSAYDGADVYGG